MANYDIGSTIGHYKVVDKRTVNGTNAVEDTSVDEAAKIGQLRAKLTALNGTYYTAAFLNTQTHNDLIYALRLENSSAGL
jgi:hypothetical protein